MVIDIDIASRRVLTPAECRECTRQAAECEHIAGLLAMGEHDGVVTLALRNSAALLKRLAK